MQQGLPTSTQASSPGVAVLFSQQTVGLGARKTSLVFLAEALRDRGFDVCFVTVQLSWLSRLKGANKVSVLPPGTVNRWYQADGMHGFVWVPPVHPVSAGGRISQRLTAPLVDLYGHFLPRAILAHLAGARVVIVESCAAVALTRTIRRAAPDARIIYSMSDRLDAVGMHPALQRRLLSDAGLFDLVRVPAHAMERDVPGARVAVIRHGIDTRSFDRPSASPYEGGRNAVLVGDMMLDQALLGTLADRFPQVRFHYFGRTTLDIAPRPNLKAWGEQPFERLIPFVQHADVGLALYRPAERLDYLAESSLKNLQYQYCRLPMVTPAFAARGAHHVFPYDPAEPETLMEAFTAALAAGRAAEQPAAIRDWKHVAGEMLRQAGVPS